MVNIGEKVPSRLVRVVILKTVIIIALATSAFALIWILVWPVAARFSAQDEYLVSSIDCFDARSALAEWKVTHIESPKVREAVYRSALLGIWSCLEKARIERWMLSNGVSADNVKYMEYDALVRSKSTVDFIAEEMLVR